jgi:hypothetical protein
LFKLRHQKHAEPRGRRHTAIGAHAFERHLSSVRVKKGAHILVEGELVSSTYEQNCYQANSKLLAFSTFAAAS